jgi:hypothetical protein
LQLKLVLNRPVLGRKGGNASGCSAAIIALVNRTLSHRPDIALSFLEQMRTNTNLRAASRSKVGRWIVLNGRAKIAGSRKLSVPQSTRSVQGPSRQLQCRVGAKAARRERAHYVRATSMAMRPSGDISGSQDPRGPPRVANSRFGQSYVFTPRPEVRTCQGNTVFTDGDSIETVKIK